MIFVDLYAAFFGLTESRAKVDVYIADSVRTGRDSHVTDCDVSGNVAPGAGDTVLTSSFPHLSTSPSPPVCPFPCTAVYVCV